MTSARRLFAASASLLLPAALLGTAASPAPAATRTGQVTMVCQMKAVGYNYDAVPYDTGVSFQLTVPESVKPGQSVSIKGVVSLQFPEELRKGIAPYVNTIDGYSDTISVRLGLNGSTTRLTADRWQTGKAPLGNPMVIKAPVSFPAFTVPANASGSITIDLPQNDVVKNPYASSPGTVALTGEAMAYPWNYKYGLACYRRDNGSGRIATIAVNGSSSSTGTAAAPGTTGGAAAPTGAAPTAAAATPAAASPEAAAENPFAAPTGADGTTVATGGATSTEAITPLSAERDGVRVPGWLLLLVGTGLCLLLAFYAAWLHVRMRALKSLD